VLAALMTVALQVTPASISGDRVVVYTNPDWAVRPSAQDIAEEYPSAARRDQVEGRASMACEVASDGSLANCRTTSEEPVGYGFGAAALRLAHKYRMRPSPEAGPPFPSGTVRIPIRFVLPKG
jgi:protein TonB